MLKPDKIGMLLQWSGTIKELQTNQVGNFFAPEPGQSGHAIKKNSKSKLCKKILKNLQIEY